MERVASDVEREMYGSFYLHASAPTQETDWGPLTEIVPEQTAQEKIKAVGEVSFDFIALEDDVFELGVRDSYAHLHQEGVPETVRKTALDRVSAGLFNFINTCHLKPIIRAQKGTPAEEVAEQVCARLEELLHDEQPKQDDQQPDELPSHSDCMNRPLIIVTDRITDLSIMLHHACTYQALVHDLLGTHINAVSLTEIVEGSHDSVNATNATKTHTMTMPLTKEFDDFWRNHSHDNIPQVVARSVTNIHLFPFPTSVPLRNLCSLTLPPLSFLFLSVRYFSQGKMSHIVGSSVKDVNINSSLCRALTLFLSLLSCMF